LRQQPYNGIDANLSNIYRLSNAQTRSISPENFTGEKGKGRHGNRRHGANASRDLGQGWKVSPSVVIKSKTTFTMAEITGPGSISHIWMTPTGNWRYSILRFYWDDEKSPSVEVPVGDFFCMGWGKYSNVNSLAVTVNPAVPLTVTGRCLLKRNARSRWKILQMKTWCCFTRLIMSYAGAR
jgi:hypothetical protein